MELPIYNAVISDKTDGIYAVSLVDCPATEVDWLAFNINNYENKCEFSIDDSKHCLTAPLMVANKLIYRRNGDYEYYVKYEPDTLRVMAEKMLADNTFNNIDFQHNGQIIEKGKVNLLELYIKDETKPSPFDVPDGSIICTYKINDDDIWLSATNGTFNGFSLAGYFDMEQERFEKHTDEKIKDKFMNILEKLKELVVEVEAAEKKEVETPKEEVETPTEAAETEEPTEPTEPTEPVEEPTEEPHQEDNQELDEIRAQIGDLVAQIGDLANRLTAVEEAIAKPVETPIEETPKEETTEEMDKYARIAKLIRK